MPLPPNSEVVPKALKSVTENMKWAPKEGKETKLVSDPQSSDSTAPPPVWGGLHPQGANPLSFMWSSRGASRQPQAVLNARARDPKAPPTSAEELHRANSEVDLISPQALDPDTRKSNRPYDNKLEERGYIAFNYSHDIGGNADTGTSRVLPFFENPQISETRQANYAQNKIYLRNDTARLYTYTKPRKITLNMVYTIPHVAEFFRGNMAWLLKKSSGLGGKADSLNQEKEAIAAYLDSIVAFDVHQKTVKEDIPAPPKSKFGPDGGQPLPAAINEEHWKAVNVPSAKWHKVMDFLHYAINHIRSSVINSGGERTTGPPIAILKWGSLYDKVPCIVKQYKISVDQNAGYEPRSLFPNRIKISLTLEEMRNFHGNLHGKESVIHGDLPGWESIHELGYIDPEPDGTDTRG